MISIRDQRIHDIIRMAAAYRRFFGMSPMPLDLHLLTHDSIHFLLSVDSSQEGEDIVAEFESFYSLYSVDSMVDLLSDPVGFITLFVGEAPQYSRILRNYMNWHGDWTRGAFYPTRAEAKELILLQSLFPGDPVYLVPAKAPNDSYARISHALDELIRSLNDTSKAGCDSMMTLDSLKNIWAPSSPFMPAVPTRRK